MSGLIAIARNEVRIGMRNKWIMLATAILLVFALLLVLLGAGPATSSSTDGLTIISASLATLSVYLVPLIALLLSFDAIAGEIDRGTLQLTLASPVSRAAVVLGKFLGHVIVLSIAVMIGYGLAGLCAFVAIENVAAEGLLDLARVVGTSIALGATFVAIGYVASACVRQTGTAAALAIAIWLFAVVLYDMALLGGLLADPEGVFATDLFPYLLVANPADAFRLFNLTALDAAGASTGFAAGGDVLPFAPQFAIASPFIWIAVALWLTVVMMQRIKP
ncbi:ABC transporter permease subunit [Sulfitobacter mediterraneus]|uniref:ABC transporter permease n=1 Tax=Sulfitobacter mediterraneus TaxID=83219 RepID=UPI00193A4601|nr:ABC transporter permease subunit [Sulfitobacter mediterraneus]MBM1557886.1 ABC transporter permease subunit [Sulfitobacter mediterraneus]MBM1568739.1 ABC transporter permease subunit [Sulfitobacter mediterraneus]MBM1573059.1 ABC transporter permease subunit [Sulfitobacter mediterraneus]MBM1576260.1 ABC transporter permease subunit [Sulfitobacter mediterraneus]MBM1580844.1 ABC transporter permease subunit [Sulfitobacter mediterraneus]